MLMKLHSDTLAFVVTMVIITILFVCFSSRDPMDLLALLDNVDLMGEVYEIFRN